jgi:hypothetical protein
MDGEDDLSGVGVDDGFGCGKERTTQNDWSVLTFPSLDNNEVDIKMARRGGWFAVVCLGRFPLTSDDGSTCCPLMW